jgi:RimJ/RimL family protein N-acetyltransferase
MEVFLETDRLILRKLTDSDFDALVELDSDPDVTFFITGGVAEFTEAMLGHWLTEYERWAGYGTWGVIEKKSQDFVGWFHLRPDEDREDEPELGYRFKRATWGQGYATEGSRALIDKAFSELGASRVFAYGLAIHAASRRVMEKSGLRFIRLFHGDWPYKIPGDEQGDVEYAITRDEWERDRPPRDALGGT